MPLPQIGDKAEMTKKIGDEDIRTFANLSGDTNPVHLDEEAGKNSRFGRRVAHGMLSASLISAVLGKKLPGEGSIYLGQTLKFTAPVFIDDEVTATVEVTAVREDKNIVTLKTTCTKQDGTVVIDGEATALVPSD